MNAQNDPSLEAGSPQGGALSPQDDPMIQATGNDLPEPKSAEAQDARAHQEQDAGADELDSEEEVDEGADDDELQDDEA